MPGLGGPVTEAPFYDSQSSRGVMLGVVIDPNAFAFDVYVPLLKDGPQGPVPHDGQVSRAQYTHNSRWQL